MVRCFKQFFGNPVVQMRHGVLVFTFLAASVATAHAQSMLRGTVLTDDSVAIPDAYVSLHDPAGNLKAEMVTDSVGKFLFRVANRETVTLFLGVAREGYLAIERVPVKLAVNEDISIHILMSPEVVSVAPVTVVARQRISGTLADYYEKLEQVKRGVGRALDRSVLERFTGLEVIQALEQLPGVEGGRTMLSQGVTLTVPRMRGGCVPATFLDRLQISPEQLATMNPADLEGILVYVGGEQIPADFSRLGAETECGLILAYSVPQVRGRNSNSLLKAAIILAGYLAIVLANAL